MPEIGTYIVKGKGTPEERLRVIKDAGYDKFSSICIGEFIVVHIKIILSFITIKIGEIYQSHKQPICL